MKRYLLIALVVVAFIAGSVAGIFISRPTPAAQAQAGNMITHTCDSSTILLLFLAEYYFDFESNRDPFAFEKGQFAPLFDLLMMMDNEMDEMDEMDDDEMMMDEDMLDEAVEAIMEMMMDMDESVVMLGGVEGEDPACTALRDEVQLYIIAYIYAEAMMLDEMEQ